MGVQEFFHGATRLRGFVSVKILPDVLYQGIQRRQYPLVDLGPFFYGDIIFFESESIHVCIECKELVGIVQGTEEFALHFPNTIRVEFQVVPGRRVGDEIPACGIGAVLFDGFKGVNDIA